MDIIPVVLCTVPPTTTSSRCARASRALGVELKELDEWICCGATAAHSLNPKLSIALPARNLALASQRGFAEMLAPCSMCSMQLMKAQRLMSKDTALAKEIARIVEGKPNGTRVLNLIQAFELVGLDAIKAAVKSPLQDLEVACYYGCLSDAPAGDRRIRRLRATGVDGAHRGGARRQAGRLEL